MKKLLILIAIISPFFYSCTNEPDLVDDYDIDLENVLKSESPDGSTQFFKFPESDDFDAIPQDPKNAITSEKVMLGKLLFHESGLGVNPTKGFGKGTFSCASCHFAGAGFQAGRFQGLGEGGIGFGVNGEGRMKGPLYNGDEVDSQPVRTPSAMNGADQKNMLWNGQFGATGANLGYENQFTEGTPKEANNLGYEGLEIQAIAGLGVHRLKVTGDVVTELGYREMFDAAFSDFDEDERYSQETAGLAIAAYERTLLANQAPFQKWLGGDKLAMSESEKRGAILFFDKAECVACHTGPALNTNDYYALGMKNLDQCPEEVFNANPMSGGNLGRGGFTGEEKDNYKFKVPQLYNLSDSPFYGHGSSMRSIRKVIEYKNLAIPENAEVPLGQLAFEFVPIGLTQPEIDDLTAFVKNALYDPNLLRYQPETVNSGNCIPVSDPLASNQLGCD